jgi:MFS transporter, DHA3 family, macrolide efflux protein
MKQGIRTFFIVWLSQVVSQVGSRLTSFGLGVWVYQQTGSVTQFALISLFGILPGVLLAPFLGAQVDRWDRRKAMMVSDLGAGLATLAVAILYAVGRLEIWHIYAAVTFSSTMDVIQGPAWFASIPLLVPKDQLGRINGLRQFGNAATKLVAPAIAGFLIVTIKLHGVIFIDFATFIFAFVVLLFVRIPQPEASADKRANKGSLWERAMYGWTYVRERPGLLGLFVLFSMTNFLAALVGVLVTPLMLTVASPTELGVVVSASAAGMLLGSTIMSTWGGPKRRIYGVLAFVALEGVCYIIAGMQASAWFFGGGLFGYYLAVMIDDGCYVSIFQSKVAQDVQGRMFALNHLVTKGTMPLAYFLAGPLADKVFEPLLVKGGPLAGSLGQLIGTGPGRGMGFMYMLAGVFTIVVAAAAFAYSPIRRIELDLPDAVAAPPPPPAPVESAPQEAPPSAQPAAT